MVTLKNKKRGVTLVENLVALLVFSASALGFMTLVTTLATKSSESEVKAQAALVGQAVVDDLRSRKYDGALNGRDLLDFHGTSRSFSLAGEDLTDGAVSTGIASYGDPFYIVTVNITRDTTVEPERADVYVRVSWADSEFMAGKDQSVLSFIELYFSTGRGKPE